MHIEPRTPTAKNPPEQFAGDVWVDPIVAPHDGDQRMTAALVRFAPGARTAWHSHVRGQYLRVTQGIARFGTRDGEVLEVHPGQTLYTPPGQEHFHAATDDGFMEHIAFLELGDDPATTTTWAEHVADEDLPR
jgi:quercetin dioxygenase-like cupin family protein